MTIHDIETAPKWWEPVTFKVGDRVRVRLSGECQSEPHINSGAHHWGNPLHVDSEHRAIGTIELMDKGSAEYYDSIGHPFTVRFDEPVRITWRPGQLRPRGVFAAAELELLGAAS
jgi:hypothetical protein